MTNISSLYELIKQKNKEKDRPLKIVCDWDECLQAREVYSHYLHYKEKNISNSLSFADFFKEFWEKAECDTKEFDGKDTIIKLIVKNTGIKEIEEEREKDHELGKKIKKIARERLTLYEESPLLTFSKDILQTLSEGLVSDLILPKNYDPKSIGLVPSKQDNAIDCPRKRAKNRKTFGKFPQTIAETTQSVVLADGGEKKVTRAE